MAKFSKRSMERLLECHLDLQALFNEAIKDFDLTIITGYRGQAEQDQAFADGRSKLKFPMGRHNQMPSMAVDACPSPYNWEKDEPPIKELDAHLKKTADRLGIDIVYGGDWVGFKDTDHWELKQKGDV